MFSKKKDIAAMLRLRERSIIYWLISPEGTQIKGPFLSVPLEPLGWTVVGFRAHIIGTLLHRERFEEFGDRPNEGTYHEFEK